MAPIIEFLQAQAITAALFLRKVLLWFLLPSWVRSGLEYIRTPAAAKFIKTSCIASSITLICAGVPEMVEIIRRKSSSHRSLTPFCCMIIDSIIGLWFSVSISDALGTRLRVLGIVMTVGYLSVMVVYARKPRESLGYVVATLVLVASFCGSIVAFVPREKWLDILGVANSRTFHRNHTNRAYVCTYIHHQHRHPPHPSSFLIPTYIVTAVMFAASPLADIGRVLKSRDASSLPFFMVTMLTVCAMSWALYGVILQNVSTVERAAYA